MIKLDELKEVLKDLDLGDKAADYVERISALDKYDTPDVDALNAQWNERFRKAFFTGEGLPTQGATSTQQVTEQATDAPAADDPETVPTFENLFKEE